MHYDVAVAGLGGMGSAILAHCAAGGAVSIGFEQFEPAHDLGSSHGKTRMIRTAYFEDPAYVPLVLRAYELWRRLEHESGQELLRMTGLLSVGAEESAIIEGTRRAASEHGLRVDSLSRHEIKRRYPTLKIGNDEVVLFEQDGGVLDPEKAIRLHLAHAKAHGAEMRFGTSMKDWRPIANGFQLSLSDGSEITTSKLILARGSWFKETLESLGIPIRVQRNVQVWFTPSNHSYDATGFPAFLVNRPGLPAPLYGFPDFGDGVKAAFHGFGDLTEARHIDRKINPARDIEPVVHARHQNSVHLFLVAHNVDHLLAQRVLRQRLAHELPELFTGPSRQHVALSVITLELMIVDELQQLAREVRDVFIEVKLDVDIEFQMASEAIHLNRFVPRRFVTRHLREFIFLQSERKSENANSRIGAHAEWQPTRPINFCRRGRVAHGPFTERLDQNRELILWHLLPAPDQPQTRQSEKEAPERSPYSLRHVSRE